MKRRFAERLEGLRSAEQGFTLLELLVSMVILSILVATASQLYLQHRRKAWESQVRASIRHMAGAENYFMFSEGAPAFTKDLDDLYLVGYRWNDGSVRPYVALATNETFCIQVHSSNDPSIVWHFSSDVGRPEPGPATPRECGDPSVLGTYIAGLPPETAGRDGRPSVLVAGSSTSTSGVDYASPDGDSSVQEGEFGPGGSGSTSGGSGFSTGGGSSTGTGETAIVGVESTTAFGTHVGTSGTATTGGTGSTGGPTSGCTGGGTGSGSTTGTNHPSGADRDTENGGSGNQGTSDSDPDGNENDGADKPGEDGGANTGDQDGNNGSGNDTDFEDDNRGPDYDGKPIPGASC